MGRLKSVSSFRPSLGHLENYNVNFQENELRDTAELCGPKAVMALRDYFEPLRDRGVTVSRAARSSLSVFRGALGIAWPIDHPLLAAAVTVEDDPPPKQAPEFTLELVLAIEALVSGKMITSGENAFPQLLF